MKNIVENNKLFAEFMEFKQYPIQNKNNGYIIDFKECNVPYKVCSANLKFHTDWNWLMRVVEKIENLENNLKNETREEFTQFQKVLSLPIYTKIEVIYNACVEFIKWYNNKPLVNPDEVKNNSSNKRDRVLKSIMERYGGLWNLKSAMREDEDVVLVNLCDDLNDEFSEFEVLDEIMAIFK